MGVMERLRVRRKKLGEREKREIGIERRKAWGRE